MTASAPSLVTTTGALLRAALDAAGRGWPVFPLAPRSKRPVIADWQQRATCDPDRIRRWWHRHPMHNVGIACGPAALLVLDLDAAHGPIPIPWARRGITHGRDVLALLAQQAGEPDPVDTFTVATPRGGEHRYFARPPGSRLRSTVGARGRGLGWHVDTRGPGTLITAPGSLALVHGALVPYAITWDLPVAVLPGWLVTALTPPPAPPPAAHPPPPLPVTSRRVTAYVQAAVAAECRNVATATEGHRHITVYAAAAALGELLGNGWISAAAITQHLTAAARHHLGVADFDSRELARTIRDGIAAGRENPRLLTDRPAPRHRPQPGAR
ncbi:bifunctional DNA primase/polymerase [Amycolatopsis nalaikhensis]|uniref:Bifunctional DNA primase/polymerase n=1 Tax=Amycolatopsis nalaikhensis TaxID=715472 RepID=A0ABY8X997_9PSEU|nr:bifunctional DNA primase/polymerase [Amycolatopsis sp. 2-2]WIV52872.1 bifunctional DNA primase/polymerase [Amycolatopsis sp. 2-2]